MARRAAGRSVGGLSVDSDALRRGEVSESLKAILGAPATSQKPRKYRNQPVTVDGIRFDSKREAERYQELRAAERSGAIRDLRRQVRYPLHAVGGRRVGVYVADHVYDEIRGNDWVTIVEDVKGVRTAMYIWKSRHMLAEYGISIREI